MFAIKRKAPGYAATAEQRRIEEQQRLVAAAHAVPQPAAPAPARAKRREIVYLASEIIEDEPTPVPAKQPQRLYLESEIIEDEPVLEPVEELTTTEGLKPKPVETHERPESTETLDSDELVEDTLEQLPVLEESFEKPANTSKLAKLPSLIDLMLTMNLSKSVRMNFAMLLLKQYAKYKDSPQDKAILIECLKRLIASLSKG